MVFLTEALVYVSVVAIVICLDENALQNALMQGYNRNVSPPSEDGPVTAKMSMNLVAITDFDEISEVITTNSWLHITWPDTRLKWRIEEYNTTLTFFRQEQIWYPDLTVINSAEEFKTLGHDTLNVYVTNDGVVSWVTGLRVSSLCHINTELYPFDKQTCNLIMIPWTHKLPDVDVTLFEDFIDLGDFYKNGLWEVTSTSAEGSYMAKIIPLIEFRLELTRRSEFYVTAIILPVLILSFLNCFAFIIPRSSGEKISYSTAILLSYTVLLTYINDKLPKTSKSLFVSYISVMLGLACISVVCTVLGMVCQKSGGNQSDSTSCCTDKGSLNAHSEKKALPGGDVNIEYNGKQECCSCNHENSLVQEEIKRENNGAMSRRIRLRLLLRYIIDYFMFTSMVIATVVFTTITMYKLLRY